MNYAQATKNDSINYFYTGLKTDVKSFMRSAGVSLSDSSEENEPWISITKGDFAPVMKTDSIDEKEMPLLAGMTLKDAVYLCENLGLKVSVKGKGKVMAQSLTAGEPVRKGQLVNIELN
jgi:cell division protein FtsI (penicillin-binding protein 3)